MPCWHFPVGKCQDSAWPRECVFVMQCCCPSESRLCMICLIYSVAFCLFYFITETDEMLLFKIILTSNLKAFAAKQWSPTDNEILHSQLLFQPLLTVLPLSALSGLWKFLGKKRGMVLHGKFTSSVLVPYSVEKQCFHLTSRSWSVSTWPESNERCVDTWHLHIGWYCILWSMFSPAG